MPFAPAVVPCGPGYAVRGRRVLGFLACISCDSGIMTVTPDKLEKLRAYCLQAEGGCGSKIEIAGEAWADHSAAELVQHRDDIAGWPAFYREHLARSWLMTTDHLKDTLDGKAQPLEVSEGPARPEKKPGNSQSGNSEISAKPTGKSGPGGAGSATVDGAGSSGPIPAPVPSAADDGAATGEPAGKPGGFLSW